MKHSALIVATAITFSLTLLAHAQKERTLYSFTGGSDGYTPWVGLISDSSGNLYGGTLFGGTASGNCLAGCGTVFQLARNGENWSFKTLHIFAGDTFDVGQPSGSLAFDLSGNLFGAGQTGGGPPDCYGGFTCGGVFKLSRSDGWNESVIYSFTPKAGNGPSGLRFYKGSLYGTTTFGPGSLYILGNGTIYRLFLDKSGQWERKGIYAFTGGVDGSEPGFLIFDHQGNLYGEVPNGGSQAGYDFELTEGQNGIAFSAINDAPVGPLIFDKNGNAYGILSSGGSGNCGAYGCGSIVELQRTATGWNQITLYDFTDPTDGEDPGGLVLDKDGNLYGTTFLGGTGTCTFYQYSGCGTVFKLTAGKSGWQKRTLYNFTGGRDGEFPNGNALLIGPTGNLYGATEGGETNTSGYGTIFEIQP